MKQMQKSSTRLIALIGSIILVVIIGAIVWNLSNQDSNRDADKKIDTVSSQISSKNKMYKNDLYSFEYDPAIWKVDEEGYSGKYRYGSRILTLDHASTPGKSIDTGAEIAVLVEESTKTLEEIKADSFSTISAVGVTPENVQDIKISGDVPAVSYEIEGFQNRSSTALFTNNGYTYSVSYQSAKGTEPSKHMSGYKTLLSSFKFK